MTTPAYLGLGSNVGDRLHQLTAAVYALDDIDGLAVEDTSGVYETAPWPPPEEGGVEQEPFYNLVVKARTTLDPHELLAETQLVEAAFGRDRSREVRWGPRPLDIDLLVVGDEVVDTPDLVLPHPRLAERAFVLVPLLEVWPGGTLPDGHRLTSLLAALAPVEGIELVVRLEDVPSRRIPRPEGPGAPPASFTRPGAEPVAREHGATDDEVTRGAGGGENDGRGHGADGDEEDGS